MLFQVSTASEVFIVHAKSGGKSVKSFDILPSQGLLDTAENGVPVRGFLPRPPHCPALQMMAR